MEQIDKQDLHNIFYGIKRNDKKYFNQLYEKYRKLVYAIAFSILKNNDDSEDVVQKVFEKIWKIEKQNLPKINELNWLYAVTKNEAIDLIKNQKDALNIDDLYYISEDNKELSNIIDNDSYNKIIAKLNSQEQEIISLKIISNLSFKEIAQILNISENTAKWKYYKSIHTLQLLLSNLGMFIITFAIGLRTIFSKQPKSSQIENTVQDSIIPDTSTTSAEQTKNEYQEDSQKQEIYNNTYENTTEEIVVPESVNLNNYFEIGILGISSVFLILTIIFSIIFTKHQLNKKHKSSK